MDGDGKTSNPILDDSKIDDPGINTNHSSLKKKTQAMSLEKVFAPFFLSKQNFDVTLENLLKNYFRFQRSNDSVNNNISVFLSSLTVQQLYSLFDFIVLLNSEKNNNSTQEYIQKIQAIFKKYEATQDVDIDLALNYFLEALQYKLIDKIKNTEVNSILTHYATESTDLPTLTNNRVKPDGHSIRTEALEYLKHPQNLQKCKKYKAENHTIYEFDGVYLPFENSSVTHITGKLRVVYTKKPEQLSFIESSNSGLLDLFSTLDEDFLYRSTVSPPEINLTDNERREEYEEYLTKIAHKARVEEFVHYEFDNFIKDLKTDLTQHQSSKYYIMYNEIKNSEPIITNLPTEFNSFEEAFNARPQSDKHTYYIVELNNQTTIDKFKTALASGNKNYSNQNNIMLNNLLNNESLENLPESLNRFYKIDKNESTLDSNKIVYNPNSSVIARFEKAIHEISVKENDLKDSILLKLFSDDDIINSKLIALQELKKELKDKLSEIQKPNNQAADAKDISVASVVEAFENKNKENSEAINKHRFFSSSKPSVTRKLVDHLKSDPEYKLTKR